MNNTLNSLESLASQDKDNQFDVILAKYDRLKITDQTAIGVPSELVKLGDAIICTEGNITTISGASKSGKSAFTNILMAGAIAIGRYDGLIALNVKMNTGKAVIHFDTEQARHKHQKNLNSILKRANLNSCPANFLSYNIREEQLKSYRYIVSDIVKAAYRKFGGIHMIIVDGLADFLKDVNDPEQSNSIVKFFEDIAIQCKTSVIVIVHQNPNSDKERGHLGSQLQRKSESVLSVKANGYYSTIEPKLLRMAGKNGFPSIEMIFDDSKGYHVDGSDFLRKNREIESRLELSKWTTSIFSDVPITYTEAVKELMDLTSYAKRSCKTKIKEMLDAGLIVKDLNNLYILNK